MGRWTDGQWVRFIPDPKKIGGCEQVYDDPLTGIVRSAFAWDGPSGIEFRAFASERKLYAADIETQPANITPLRVTAAALATDPFAVTDTSTRVGVTHTAHGAIQGDTVIFHDATAGGGITISGSYTIDELIDANSYAINHSSAATSTDATTGGASVTADYEVNIGSASASRATGFGTGTFGTGTFGTPRLLSSLILEGRFWALDNYGTNLLASYQGGRVYLYDSSVDSRAQVLQNSPEDTRFAFVTEERYIMELCDGMWLRWPDRDDPTDATPSDLNTANARRLASGNRLMCGAVLGGGISLIWTDSSLYLAQFIGLPFIYDTRVVATSAGICGPAAFAIVDGSAFWNDGTNLRMFVNSVVPIPNYDDVADWFTSNITVAHKAKSYTFFNASHREVWFVFPAFGHSECSHFCAVNIDRWDWTSGEIPANMSRSAAADRGDRTNPIMVATDGVVYRHEVGVDANGEAIQWSIKSGLFSDEDSARTMDLIGFIFDTKEQIGLVTLTLRAQYTPQSVAITEQKIISPTDTRVDPRLSGIYFGIELSQEELSGDFHGGKFILNLQAGGER